MDEAKLTTILLLSLFILLSGLYVRSVTTPEQGCIDCPKTIERGFPVPWLVQTEFPWSFEWQSQWQINWGYFIIQIIISFIPAMIIGKASRKYELL